MKEIPLTKGLVALVDDEDFEALSRFKWHVGGSRGYAMRGGFYMHREILKPANGVHIDHVNGNPLDNRRANLRLATRSENQQNRRGANHDSTSGFRGVYLNRRLGKWYGQVRFQGRNNYLGSHASPELAALAVQEFLRLKGVPHVVVA